MVGIIILLILLILLLILYFKYFKRLKIKNVVFIDGSLGTGKSYLSLCIAYRQYKHNKRMVYLYNFFHRKNKKEIPLLYSNIKLRVPYVPVTLELMQRKNYRFRYGSVMFIDEMSLVLDQMCFKDKEINERASEFFKLFRHETKGGYLVINSQAIGDNHYSLKYILNDYIYIHSKLTLFGKLPIGFSILRIQERVYDSDKSTVQTNEGDIEDNIKMIFVRKKYFKMYDTYCHSVWTDMLPVYDDVKYLEKKDSLKSDDLVSFKALTYLKENIKRKENNKNG